MIDVTVLYIITMIFTFSLISLKYPFNVNVGYVGEPSSNLARYLQHIFIYVLSKYSIDMDCNHNLGITLVAMKLRYPSSISNT